MKKYMSILLCLLLALTLSGCQRHTKKDFSSQTEVSSIDDEDDDEDDISENITEETPSEDNTATDDDTSSETDSQPSISNKKVIVIDPGHQAKANTATEPIGPGASEKKAKVTGGATGKKTGTKESEIVLAVGMILKKKLEAKGYTVIMTRTSQDVDLSNRERAAIANEAHADAFIRLHCDGSSDTGVQGASVLAPANNNPYLTKSNIKESQALCSAVIKAFCETTNAKNRGISKVNNMSGINWCEVPVCLIEMGFLSNADEEKLLVSDDYQDLCADGIMKGIINYLEA